LMSSHDYKSAQRPSPDDCWSRSPTTRRNYKVDSLQAYETAKYCLMDTLACGFQALKYPACTRLLDPWCPARPCRADRACPARATSSTR
jgi:2-methylcitrate dehydratase